MFLIFCVSCTSAQESYDTIYFSGKQFVEHVVQGGESLRSIADIYGVSTSDIKETNELNKRLFYNQLLYIPIHLNIKDKATIAVKDLMIENSRLNSTVMNIALLMPYYLPKNDFLNQSQDTLELINRYYTKSNRALSFHLGLELALDSLRKAGRKIVLYTFDTNKDSSEVKKIVYSNQLDNMDIIIGPMYSKLFQIICRKYGNDNNKILISPLSRDDQAIKEFSSVYQVALTYKVQTDILAEYLIGKKMAERIIILHDKKENGLAMYLAHRFKQENKTVKSFQVTSTAVDSIRRYFVDTQNVLLLSKDKAFISKILGSIGSIDSISTIFTFESVSYYDNLDITNLMELDIHIPRLKNSDSSSQLDFISLFEKEYNTNADRYSKVAYDIIMHFCANSAVYDFKQNNHGYFQNISGSIYHYFDYGLVAVD